MDRFRMEPSLPSHHALLVLRRWEAPGLKHSTELPLDPRGRSCRPREARRPLASCLCWHSHSAALRRRTQEPILVRLTDALARKLEIDCAPVKLPARPAAHVDPEP